IAHTTTIRAAVFAEDYLPGPIAQSAFLFLDPEVAAFHSNMPILIADSAGVHVDANFSPFDQRDYRPVFSALFEPDQTDARARPLSTPSFASFGAMRVRGHSSALQYPKKQYAWEVRDDRGQDRDVSLLGLPADSDWVLAAPYSDKSLMRNVLAYMAGQVCFGAGGSSQTRYIELFFNQDGDDVTMADYQGIYVLTEKIKRGTGRIDIAGLNETITDPAQITGGYIFKFDKGTDWDQRIRTGVHQLRAALVEPNRLNAVQSRYLTEYLTNFERSLNSSLRADPAKGYRAFIDPDSFLLMNWMVEIFYELDGWWLSSYFTKDRGGKIRAMPLWDYNLAMGNSNQVAGYDAKGWYRDAKVVTNHPWFKRLLADPAMEQRRWELYEKLRKNEFSNERITTYISDLAIYLEEAARRNFKRWPILGESVWPEPRGTRDRTTYRSEVEFLHKWLIRRLEWIDSQFVPTAKLQRVGDHLQISLGDGRSGQIFYTTDGTDPGWRRNPDHSLLLDGSAAPCTVLIPTESNGGDKLRIPDWTEIAPPPNIANWTRAKRASIGFEREPSVFDPFLEHRVDSMYGKSTTCYIRIPFEINTPDAITKLDELCLRMRCDDGFVAYLNGQKIAEKNAPAKLDWQATATRTVSERRAVQWIRFDLEEARGTLRSGKNMLAIHGLNERLKSSDALWSAQLAYVDPANRRPAANARPYRAPIPLTEVHEVRVAVFNGRSWSRTTNWKK
ncbi:MAG: CotH kinase family protein, partial [Planctomycetota bacterium]|nr:CotH kinase family protein [Planctomycetota bacterium]